MPQEHRRTVMYTKTADGYEQKDETEVTVEKTEEGPKHQRYAGYLLVLWILFQLISNIQAISSLKKEVRQLQRFNTELCVSLPQCQLTVPEKPTEE